MTTADTAQADHAEPGTSQEIQSLPSNEVKGPQSKIQNIEWDLGTAYDLLLSVHTILKPKDHGVPAPWAAGVRKRLSPQGQRELKEFFGPTYSYRAYTPLHLVLEMEPPKDAQHFLDYVEAIPDEDFTRRIHAPYISD